MLSSYGADTSIAGTIPARAGPAGIVAASVGVAVTDGAVPWDGGAGARSHKREGNARWLKRLGDQEGRLRPPAGEKTLWVGSDENDWHFKRVEQFIDRVEARASIGELDVGEGLWP